MNILDFLGIEYIATDPSEILNNNIINYNLLSKIKELHIFNKDIFGSIWFNNIYNSIIIEFLIILSIICATYTILSKNPIISVLFLIGLYISVASYVMLIGLQFIGLSYILIYVGAISILFIFILMLINIRISELLSNTVNSFILIIILTSILNSILYTIIPNNYNIIYNSKNIQNFNHFYESDIFNVSNIKWDSSIMEYNTISSLANTLYTEHLILFLEASLILLLAMIGAIIITIKSSNAPVYSFATKNINNNK